MSPKPTILFITTHFPPSENIGTQRIVKIIKYLHRKGWKIIVLTQNEKYNSHTNDSYRFYLPEGIEVYRTGKLNIFGFWDNLKKSVKTQKKASVSNDQGPTTVSQENGNGSKRSVLFEIKEIVTLLMRYPDGESGWAIPAFRKAFTLLFHRKIDYVLVSSPPHTPHVFTNLLRKLFHFKYIVDFRDPWSRSQWVTDRTHWFQRLQFRMDAHYERKTIRLADFVIFNTPNMREEFLSFYQDESLSRKSKVITNGYDPEFGEQIQKSEQKTLAGGGSDLITIVHAGTLYKKRNPESIIEALAGLKTKNSEFAKKIRLIFIGGVSPELRYLKSFISEKGLDEQIIFETKVSYQDIMQMMRSADWLLLLQPGTDFQIPAKFFDYLLTNRPIWAVVERNSIGEQMIKELGVGAVSDCQSLNELEGFYERQCAFPDKIYHPDKDKVRQFEVNRLTDELIEFIDTNGQS